MKRMASHHAARLVCGLLFGWPAMGLAQFSAALDAPTGPSEAPPSSAVPTAQAPAAAAPAQPVAEQAPAAAATTTAPAAPVTAPAATAPATAPAAPAATAPAPAAEVEAEAAAPATSSPRPRLKRFGATVDVSMLRFGDRSYDLLSEEDTAWRFGLGAEADLVRDLATGILSVEVSWAREEAGDDLLGGVLSTELVVDHYGVGARWRKELLPFLAPYARLVVGISDTDLGIRTSDVESGARRFDSEEWLPWASLGAGVSFMTLHDKPVAVVFVVEGGYVLSSGLDLALEPSTDSDRLTSSGATLGKLARSTPYGRAGAGIRF